MDYVTGIQRAIDYVEENIYSSNLSFNIIILCFHLHVYIPSKSPKSLE